MCVVVCVWDVLCGDDSDPFSQSGSQSGTDAGQLPTADEPPGADRRHHQWV